MFVLHRSNRIEALVEALGELVAEPLPDPFAPETIAVQSLGMRTWLAQQLARRLGVWANARFPFPRDLIQQLVAAALEQPVPDPDPFQPASLTWALMACLDDLLERPAFEPLRAYLEADAAPLRCFGLAGQIARVFDQYLVYRPDLLLAWEDERGAGWQALLWRAVVARLAGPHAARRCALLHERISAGALPTGALPARICLFGLTTLPPLYLQVLARLPDEVAIHMFLFSPTPDFWGHIQDPAEMARVAARARQDPESLEEDLHLDEGHPLLASLGRQGREFQLLLEDVASHRQDRDVFVPPEPDRPASLLAQVQADVFSLRPPERARRDEADRASIEIHACHSPMREVEVLHERLRGLFEAAGDGPAGRRLQPADVIVMTPDIEAYAPLVEAVFGLDSGGPPIPYSISDRSPRTRAAVARAFAGLLELVTERLGVSDVFDLLSLQPVRERFDLSMEEVEQAQVWAREAGIRWGIDARHRHALGQEPFEDFTWRSGLDRLLLGYAWPSDGLDLFAGCSPLDLLEGQAAQSAGRWVDFCATLFGIVERARQARTWPEWAVELGGWLEDTICEDRDNAHQHRGLREILVELAAAASGAGFDQPVPFELVRAALMERLAEVHSARGFLTGGVTFCNLVPMRSIPFDVVCLMGMSDGEFPRRDRRLGFDEIARAARLGDRSARIDDRYLFLEALLSARRKLLVTYVGQSLQDNSPLPPSVVVSELLDVLGPHAGPSAVITHPLQPFSPRCFEPGGASGLVSYQRDHCEAARALLAPKRPGGPFLAGPLDDSAEPGVPVRLEDLKRFFRQPVVYLFERVLGIRLRDDAARLLVREPIEADALDRHRVGQRVLELMIRGAELERIQAVLSAGALLPPGALGRRVFDQVGEEAGRVHATWRGLDLGAALEPVELELDLGPDRLSGALDRIWSRGQARIDFGRGDGRRLLDLWIDHLALAGLAQPGLPAVSFFVGRSGVVRFAPPQGDPRRHLQDLVRLFRIGSRQPLRFFPRSSHEYTVALQASAEPVDGRDLADARALAKARVVFEPGHGRRGEGDDPTLRRAFGGIDPLTDAPADAELGFCALATRVFGPLLAALEPGGEP